MNAPRLKLSVALVCSVILCSCGGLPGFLGGLPIGFERMSEQERLKIGSDALLASCVESDVETPMTFQERIAFQRANNYLGYVATVARQGDLSRHFTQEVLRKCLTGSLEGSPQGKVRDLVYRYGSDAQILAALNLQFTVRTDQQICEYFDVFYPGDIARRVSKIVCDDSKVTIR
jgi:hypothetical protein